MSKTGYKTETLRGVVRDLMRIEKDYARRIAAGEKIPLSISTGNSKIGRCLNVSLSPIVTCGNCAGCKHFCYDVGACIMRGDVVKNARAKNTAIFMASRDSFFSQLWDRMSRRRKNLFLRFHVSGEIQDVDHVRRIVETAARFPAFKVWTYTKMYGVVNEYCRIYGKESIPGNLSIMFSEWKGVPINNPFGFPVFRCIMPGEKIPPQLFHCPGNCDECKASGRGCVAGESSYVDLH